jgi:hypothetical protein
LPFVARYVFFTDSLGDDVTAAKTVTVGTTATNTAAVSGIFASDNVVFLVHSTARRLAISHAHASYSSLQSSSAALVPFKFF